VSAALTVKSGGTLAIGSPGSAVGTMNVTGDVTLQSGGTNDVTASGAQCDLLAVAGAVQLGGILSAAISVAGTYTNMTAIGGFSGGFAVVTNTLPGLALSVVTNATVLQLVASSPATEADGVWALDQDGDWSNTARWQSGTIASGTNKTADFSQVDITAVRTVTLDSDRTLGRLLFGDTSGADTWTLIANPSSKTLTLDAGGGTPVISNSVTTTIGALLAGTSGFAKQGAGTLIISNNNTGLSGAIAVDGGTLQVDGIGAQGSGAVTVNGGAVLSGTGAMSAAGTALTVKSGGTLAIGSPAGAVGTMNVSGNVALEAGATNAVTVSGSACDLLAVAGSAQLGGTLITAISSAGTRSIMTASGGFSGSFAVVTNTVAGVTLSATIVNATNLQLTAVYTDADGVWTNNGSGNWSDANNWQNGTMASGTNRIADFSQIDITSNRTVTQDASSVTVGTLKFADTAASHDWIVTNNAIALAVGSGAPTISVTNCTATIYSRLTGSQGFIKTGGGGTLTLADDNSAVLSGGVTVSNGTMQLNHLGGAGGGTLTIQSSATVSPGPGRLIVNASGTKDVTLDGVDTTSGYSGDMIVSNGISWSGTITFNNYKNTSRSFGITSFGATAIINPTIAWGTNNTVSNIAFTGQGSFSGSGNLGAGSLKVTLTGDNQTNQLTSDAWSFGSVVLYTSGNGTVIKMGVDNFFHGAPVSYIANNTDRGLALDLNGHSQDIGGLTLPNNGTVYGFNNPVVTNSSATVATLTLSGSGTYSFTNGASAGWIAGNLSLVKKGAGTQTLGGINTYTGDTIISNGVLKLVNAGMISNNASIVLGPAGVLDVSLIAGGFNVLSNQALAGAGTVTGNVNLASGGILSPAGTNTAGTLTLSGDAVISDGTRYNWNYDGGQNTSDTVRVSGNLTLPAMASVNVSSSGALQAKRAALFTYGGTCERTDFSGWIINPGYTLLNDTEQQCVYVIPPPQGSVYRIR
jgi:autotransporter-associated beta strand protein